MLRVPFHSVLFASLICFSVNATQGEKPQSISEVTYNNDDFLPLSEPERVVNGAYYGLGITMSRLSGKLNLSKNGQVSEKYSRSVGQYDLSAIVGFGAAFYERYYTGVELEFFKRFPEKTSRNEEVGIIYASNMGMNMDVRFGYQFPKYAALTYVTLGFARVIGKAAFYAPNAAESSDDRTFGSFYPTVGVGLEYKVNHLWNVRGDLRYSITSKDDNKDARVGANAWKFDGKPNRCAFRISLTRTI